MVFRHMNQRSSPRKLLVCPIYIHFSQGTVHGILRDISADGIFFYSNFKPSLGMNLNFTLRINDRNVTGTGEVVRIEENRPGAAIGVAVKMRAGS